MTTPAALAWHEERLTRILPGAAETALLRACLTANPAEARAAWASFVRRVGDAKRYFEVANGGLKGLLPFVEDSLRRNRVDPGAAFLTHARVAVVREDLRARIYRDAFAATLDALRGVELTPIVLRGLPLAIRCYPAPARRHNHGIELLLDPSGLVLGERALLEMGCGRAPGGRSVPGRAVLTHASGLAITLHTRVFELPHLDLPLDELRARAEPDRIDGRPVWVPGSADHLVHVCGHAGYSASRANLRWACDAVQLIRVDPALDWSQVIASAVKSRLALPLAVMLRYLHDALGVEIPEHVTATLRMVHRLFDHATREAIYAMCLEGPFMANDRLPPRSASRRGVPLSFLWFRLLPSRKYMAWKYGTRGWSTAARYVTRPFRFAARRLTTLTEAIQ